MKINKQHFIGAAFGALLIAVFYLGYVFFNEINAINNHEVRINQLFGWVCSKDPVSCNPSSITSATSPVPDQQKK